LSTEGAAFLERGEPHAAVEVLRRGVAAGEPAAPDLLISAYLDCGHWHCVIDWLGPRVQHGAVHYAGRLGVALYRNGDVARAEVVLRAALNAGHFAAANDLAILLCDEGRRAEAVQVLTEAAYRGDPQAGANLSSILLEAGDVSRAEQVAQHWLDESRPDTFTALADVRSAQGREAEAEDLYKQGIELGAVRAHTGYADFLLVLRGDEVAAEAELRAAAQAREPGWAVNLGRFLLDGDRPDEAREYLQIALDHGDDSVLSALAEIDGEDPYDD
jgi:Tfp pilus assembly protein PilF